MDSRLTDLLEQARAAVIVKDGGGYCVYANRREEALRGLGPGDLVGQHITALVDADPELVEREWQRFIQERSWVGHFRIHDAAGLPIRLRSYNFVHREWDGNLLYMSFGYVLRSRSALAHNGLMRSPRPLLRAEDLCIGQLCVDGYSDDQIALLLGVPEEGARQLVAAFVERMGAASRTEACVRALKAGVAV